MYQLLRYYNNPDNFYFRHCDGGWVLYYWYNDVLDVGDILGLTVILFPVEVCDPFGQTGILVGTDIRGVNYFC